MRTPRLLLPAVAYRDLTSRFDSGALNRGIAYAQEQRLAAVSWFADDLSLIHISEPTRPY